MAPDVSRPALVAPGEALSRDAATRSVRQRVLPGFGDEAQRRLRAARVLVIGAGGLGSACVPYLAGAGVGTLGIVDDDVVSLSNLHRQVTHTTASIGTAKTASLARAVAELDASVAVHEHPVRLDANNARALFDAYDLVIDGSDNFTTRFLVDDAARLTDTPVVWGAILQFHGQVGVSWHAEGPGYRDLFPEPPVGVLDCAVGGVLPGLCGTIGTLMATEALKLVTGMGEPLVGRVLVYDALAARTREVRFERDPDAAPVAALGAPGSLSAADLSEVLSTGARLLDVRTAEEHAERALAGSLHVPLDALEQGAEVPQDAPLVVYCARGPRSERAAAILATRGAEVRWLRGGIQAVIEEAP